MRGPGLREFATTNARGIARLRIRPPRPGRLAVRVGRGLETLGCSTTGRIVPARAGVASALTGRVIHE